MAAGSSPFTRTLGVTMRVVGARDYAETRDALDQRWGRLLSRALPGARWMAVPNIGAEARDYADAWGLDGLILTGGDDIGQTRERDDTERALLDRAVAGRLPVFGVCRGLQMIQTHFGGTLVACDRAAHVATRHAVRLDGRAVEVNSFHGRAIAADGLASSLVAVATDGDGCVEAARHADLPVLGVMWHPEREDEPAAHDIDLMRGLFS